MDPHDDPVGREKAPSASAAISNSDAPIPDHPQSADDTYVTDSRSVDAAMSGGLGQVGVPGPAEAIPPYKFDPAHVRIATEILDAAFADPLDGAGGWGVVEKLITGRTDVDPALARELTAIGAHGLDLAPGKNTPNCAFEEAPWLQSPRDSPADVVTLWRSVVGDVSSPAAIARLQELLVLRRDGPVVNRVRAAISGYLDAVTSLDDFNASTYLVRAWTLTRKFNQADLEDEVLDQVEKRIAAQTDARNIGWLLPILAVACANPTNALRRDHLHLAAERLLAQGARAVRMSHLVHEIANLRRRLVEPGPPGETKRTEIRADEMAGLKAIASQPHLEALVKQSHLKDAAIFATRHNLRADLRDLQRELEEVSRGDLGLERNSFSIDIPRWLTEVQLKPYTRGDTWHRSLVHFLTSGPPTGELDTIKQHGRSLAGGIRSIFPTQLLGADGLPRMTISTPEQHLAHDMSQYATLASQHSGQVLALGLHRIAQKYGVPPQAEVRRFLTDMYKCDPASANLLATALTHFWQENYLEAVYLTAPATEDGARRLLRLLDEGAYLVQVGKSPGKYPGLGVLLDELLKHDLDPSWHYYLTWLLLGPLGANVRNDVAHGFTKSVDPVHAALTLRAAALLITASGSAVGGSQRITLAAAPLSHRGAAKSALGAAVSRVSTLMLKGHLMLEQWRSQKEES